MKKLLLIASCLALLSTASTTTKAQAPVQFVNPSGSASVLDTVTDGTTTYLATRIPAPGILAIQLNVKKVSGTVGGYAILQGSIDKDYSPTMWANISTDTLTLANSDNAKLWAVPANYLHYRVKIVSSGTQKFTPKAYYIHKKTFGP